MERAFREFVDIEDTMEEGIDAREEFQAPKNSNFEEEFGLHDIVDWFNVLKKMLTFTTF